MTKYNDLIYYKQDVVNEYANKRKSLDKKEVEDLLRCAILFLEKEAKKENNTSLEVPNIGFLHKKVNLNMEEVSGRITKEDNSIVRCAYIDTTYLPIIMRKDMLYNYYPNIDKKELQQIQNNK